MSIENKEINIFAEYVDGKALSQFYEAMAHPANVAGALMPDVHAGYTLPIGAVVKSKDAVFPAYVGYDIGCGVAAFALDLHKDDLDRGTLEKIRDEILKNVPVGRASHSAAQKWGGFKRCTPAAEKAIERGAAQMGTLGSGNHFIEMGVGRDGKVWVAIHSGSRGFGHAIATHYMKVAAKLALGNREKIAAEFEAKNDWKAHNPEGFEKAKAKYVESRIASLNNVSSEGHYALPLSSGEAEAYLQDMGVALDFAEENRLRMLLEVRKAVAAAIGRMPRVEHYINRHHNHAELKTDGGNFVIHRKGATHADEGLWGVIPGNMRDGFFIVKGKGHAPALNSSSHGAGRVMSRSEAREIIDFETLKEQMEGVVCNASPSTVDEAPDAHKTSTR